MHDVTMWSATATEQSVVEAGAVDLRGNCVSALASHDDASSVCVFLRGCGLAGKLREVAVAVGQIGDRQTREESSDSCLSRVGWRGHSIAFHRSRAAVNCGAFASSWDFEFENNLRAAA